MEDRGSNDLGRFGLGLKTASFSQARKLTVLSKKLGCAPAYWTWDLDYVNQTGQWNLIKYLPENLNEQEYSENETGTLVMWNDIDRVVKHFRQNDNNALEKFLHVMELVKKHLAMVFHRFIESKKLRSIFKII